MSSRRRRCRNDGTAMSTDELCALSLSEVSTLIAGREVSPVAVTEAVLARIEHLDPHLNAFVTVTGEAALAEARAAEAEIARGAHRGPLHGVPISLKDLLFTAGVRTTAGSRILANFVPDRDATVVRSLRACGAVLVGKTNMMEFAYGEVHPDFGPSRNPWQPEYGTSGSSSGSGAAVATGLGFGSIGSDTGGSIRGPAGFCGVVGLKPTYGLVSRSGVVPLSWSLDHVGPMTRTVRDCAILLDAIAGHDPADPTSARLTPPGYAARLDQPAGGRPIVGIAEPDDEDGVTPEVRQAVDAAALAARDLGCETRQVTLPHPLQTARTLLTMIYAEASAYHLPWLRDRADDYSANTRERLELGALLPASLYLRAQRVRAVIVAAYREIFRQIDLLLLPTSPMPSYRLDDPFGEPVSQSGDEIQHGVRFAAPFNLTGQPAVSLPAGATPDGLPIGVQLVGRPFAESELLRAAAALEPALASRLPSRQGNPLVV
ncbi:MAG: Asp-tRNA(Asn)/Glu-tRNA(Gln) amidotransferase GatCAB subunit [Thermomicrobiales bacterium]|nr:Asp-tRNA(Asn)/Glu-tRNA(Gln) amidotransferase GatCAB subunit [Thermomicrobiales bacterium]